MQISSKAGRTLYCMGIHEHRFVSVAATSSRGPTVRANTALATRAFSAALAFGANWAAT